jgi:hypothetical protein
MKVVGSKDTEGINRFHAVRVQIHSFHSTCARIGVEENILRRHETRRLHISQQIVVERQRNNERFIEWVADVVAIEKIGANAEIDVGDAIKDAALEIDTCHRDGPSSDVVECKRKRVSQPAVSIHGKLSRMMKRLRDVSTRKKPL